MGELSQQIQFHARQPLRCRFGCGIDHISVKNPRCKSQGRMYGFVGQTRMGRQYLLRRLACCHLLEDEFNRNPGTSYDRFAHHDLRVGYDDIVVHNQVLVLP